MRNIDRALDNLKWLLTDYDSPLSTSETTDIQQAIELASKPDWFHPSKGEFPINGKEVLIERNSGKEIGGPLYNFYDDETDYWIKAIKAWTYLPTYKFD